MARPYTRLLGSVTLRPGTESQEIFTAPEGYVTIVRDILVCPASGVRALFNLTRSTGGEGRQLVRRELDIGELFHLELRQVIPVGMSLNAYWGSDQCDVSVTGYQLLDDS